MTRTPKTLIVPGLDGSVAPHWQDWWARTDPDAMMVVMPDCARPVREVWEAALAAHILRYPGCFLVGHSLGATTIVRLLTHWPGLRVRGALLVAPVDPRGDAAPRDAERIRGFGPLPRRRLDVPSLVVASRNDPWMPMQASVTLAAQWGSALHDLGQAGHVNTASGFGPWAGGKALRDQLVAATARPAVLQRLRRALPASRALPPHPA